MASDGRLRIAILGGGMGGLATAWSLASEPGGQDRYAITVYEQSARLGGKGASARDLPEGSRVLEHGLHVLMGFYHESLKLLHDVYATVSRRHPGKVLPWDRALLPWDCVMMADRAISGGSLWQLCLPSNGRMPGKGGQAAPLGDLLGPAVLWYESFRKRLFGALQLDPIGPLVVPPPRVTPENAGALATALRSSLEGLAAVVLERLESLGDAARRAWIGAWFAGTNVIGAADSVLGSDYEAIDGFDYRDWLAAYTLPGLPRSLTVESPPVEALYDLAFSHGRTLAAGTALRVVVHMLLDYEGHVAYKLNGGMGDVVFAPLLLALRDLGVDFSFHHTVTRIEVDAARRSVRRIWLDCGPRVLEELVPLSCEAEGVEQLRVWPEQPYLDESPPGPAPPLEAGRDFDVAVLAIPVGALAPPHPLADELASHHPAFDEMRRRLGTTPTQALQLWCNETLAGLGWPYGEAMLLSYVRPFNSWVDMSHVTALECWPAGAVQTLAYFCDDLPDSTIGGRSPDVVVAQNADAFIAGALRALWPRIRPANIVSRYTRANHEPWERYVLAEAGTSRYRLEPGASGYHNLALAGDWVRTLYNAGCLEAAVLGGLGAAEAVRSGAVHA